MSMSGTKMQIFFVCVLLALAVQMSFASLGLHLGGVR
jgi:hypothetical protein